MHHPPSDYVLKPGDKWVSRSTSTVPVVIVISLLTLWPLSTLCEHGSHLSCLKQGIQTCTSLLRKHSTVHLPQSSGRYSNASWMMVFLTTLFKIHYSFTFTFFSLVQLSPAKTIYFFTYVRQFLSFCTNMPWAEKPLAEWVHDFWPQASFCNVSSQCLLFGWFSLLKTAHKKFMSEFSYGR